MTKYYYNSRRGQIGDFKSYYTWKGERLLWKTKVRYRCSLDSHNFMVQALVTTFN